MPSSDEIRDQYAQAVLDELNRVIDAPTEKARSVYTDRLVKLMSAQDDVSRLVRLLQSQATCPAKS